MALLEIEHVSKRFGGVSAITDVSLTIAANEIVFIVGPNGAGKTTLFNLITGVLHRDEGRIRFDDEDITRIGPSRAARAGIGRTFQIVKPLAQPDGARERECSVHSCTPRSRPRPPMPHGRFWRISRWVRPVTCERAD